jgi:predicted  nucleic acid-binding Zn ribbon protein
MSDDGSVIIGVETMQAGVDSQGSSIPDEEFITCPKCGFNMAQARWSMELEQYWFFCLKCDTMIRPVNG